MHPHPEAVQAYEGATNDRLYCTNRQGTVRIYGYQDGRIRVNRQRTTTDSCTFTGN